MDRARLKALLDEKTLEEILEENDVEVIDALEYLYSYGVLRGEDEPPEDE